MKRKKLLELRMIGLTDEIRDMARADQGKKKEPDLSWRSTSYLEFDVRNYLRAEVEDGTLKLEIYPGKDIRKCNEEPVYRIYLSAGEDRYITYLQRKRKWSQAKMRNLSGTEWDWDNIYKNRYWIAGPEEEVVRKYLGVQDRGRSIQDIIEEWQTNAMHRKEIKETDRVMGQITETPADFGQWVRREAFWGQQYLFYNAGKRAAYCTACGQTINTKVKSIHNQYIVCPACGRRVMGKSWNKQKSLRDTQEVALIQKISEGLIVREFHCRKELALERDWREKVNIYEERRRLYTRGLTPVRDYEYTWFKQYGPLRWCESPYIDIYKRVVVYPGNLEKIREDTRLTDTPLEIMLEREKGQQVSIEYLLHPGRLTGYLIHAGLTRLAMEGMERSLKGVNEKAGAAREALGIDGNRIHRLKECNGGRITLAWLQYEQETGKKIPQETLERLEERKMERGDLKEILACGISPQRALNYLEKQKGEQQEVLTEWRDYLGMARREGLDMGDDIVRFPKDLRRRHNELVERRNEQKNRKKLKRYKEIDAQIRTHIPEAARYYWEDEDYMIVPAAKCEELMREGQTLHHCVGASTTYMDKMAAGRTWILFLRRKEELDIPWYTIEIDMETDQIWQWYSSYDRKPESEKVRKILDKFLRSVKKKREQDKTKAVRIAATA